MAFNEHGDKEQEPSLNFYLIIQQVNTSEGTGFSVRGYNEGITAGEVISITEAWLEQAKKEHREELGFES